VFQSDGPAPLNVRPNSLTRGTYSVDHGHQITLVIEDIETGLQYTPRPCTSANLFTYGSYL